MQPAFRTSTLVPRGFVVDQAMNDGDGALIIVRSAAKAGACPDCGLLSDRVHSRYRRRLADLPISGRPVRLLVVASPFQCDAAMCGRRIFTERFEANVLAPWARRTARLEHIVHHFGLALGGGLCAPAHVAAQPRHAVAGGAAAGQSPLHPAHRGRDRRLGVEAQPALRHAGLRSRAAQDRRAAARPRARDGRGLAVGAAADCHRCPRPRRRIRPGRRQGAAQGHRLGVAERPDVPELANLIRCRGQAA